jgi:hypothetical protein
VGKNAGEGSDTDQALAGTLTTLRKRIAGFEKQMDLAASTDFPPGEGPPLALRASMVWGGCEGDESKC